MTSVSPDRPGTARRASRLDAFIRRVAAPRGRPDPAARLSGARPGIVLELGLGNGRTYDHLRERFPGRDIYVFDREIAAHPACVPDEAHIRLGDFHDTLPAFDRESRAKAVLVHADIGSPDRARDAALAHWLGPALVPLLAPGALVATDRALTGVAWPTEPLPAGVAAGDYFLYRVA